MKRLLDLPPPDRPRERLLAKGARSLTDRELMAVLLGKGARGHDALALAATVVRQIDGNGGVPDPVQLCETIGVGPAKAAVVCAALEFARRRIRPEGQRIELPGDVYPLVRHFADRKQEHFLCLSLTGAREVIAVRIVTVGLVDRSQFHPREVFADPITDRAAAVIVAHNHPFARVEPSREDREVTRTIKDAGALLGIPLLDHVIFDRKSYYSFLEKGEL